LITPLTFSAPKSVLPTRTPSTRTARGSAATADDRELIAASDAGEDLARVMASSRSSRWRGALVAGRYSVPRELALQVAGRGSNGVATTSTGPHRRPNHRGGRRRRLTDIAREGVNLLAPTPAGRLMPSRPFRRRRRGYLWHGAVATGDGRADDWRVGRGEPTAGSTHRGGCDAPAPARPGSPARLCAAQHPPRDRAVDLRPVAGRAVWSVGRARNARCSA